MIFVHRRLVPSLTNETYVCVELFY